MSIRIERYRDGGSIRITDGTNSFILDQGIAKGPTYGKWLTDWPSRGGRFVEPNTPEYDILTHMIGEHNAAHTRVVKTDQLPFP